MQYLHFKKIHNSVFITCYVTKLNALAFSSLNEIPYTHIKRKYFVLHVIRTKINYSAQLNIEFIQSKTRLVLDSNNTCIGTILWVGFT